MLLDGKIFGKRTVTNARDVPIPVVKNMRTYLHT